MDINLIHIILIFLITVCVAYVFGLILINLVDNRLSKIKLNIPKQDVIINGTSIEHFVSANNNSNSSNNSNNSNINSSNNSNNSSNSTENNQNNDINNKKNNNNKINNSSVNSNFDEDYYKMRNDDSLVEGFNNDFTNKNAEWKISEKNKYKTCYKNHQHVKDGRNTECLYGITNYSDPYDMSPIDLRLFTLNYPPNMTMQDYINWLWCFKDMEDQLPYNHLKNLMKIKNGQELIQEDGVTPPPSYTYPPMDTETYFKQMYNGANEFNIAGPLNSGTGPMLGANYGEYSEFSQNQNLFGLSGTIRNKDIYLKENSKKLHDKIFPRDSNFIRMDDEYENYHIKSVEI